MTRNNPDNRYPLEITGVEGNGYFITDAQGHSFATAENLCIAKLIVAAPETAAERDMLRELVMTHATAFNLQADRLAIAQATNAKLLLLLAQFVSECEESATISGDDPTSIHWLYDVARAAIAKAEGGGQ